MATPVQPDKAVFESDTHSQQPQMHQQQLHQQVSYGQQQQPSFDVPNQSYFPPNQSLHSYQPPLVQGQLYASQPA
jgi:hypothetical protein